MKEAEQQKKKPKFQILIARYNEPLEYLKYIPEKKNRDYELIVSNSGNPQDSFECDRTIVRENVGREAGHYLDFMASEYESMADVVVFIQAGCFHHATINTILELFWGKPSFPHLMSFLGSETLVGVPKIHKWSEAEHIMKSSWQEKQWTQPIEGKPWVIGGGAQFYIKKEIVLKRPPEHYLRAIECARDPESKFAHVLEFNWPAMFDLSCLHK